MIDAGVDAVRIAPMSKRLKLSRTSFYWFFKDREQLLETLMARWRAQNTGQLVRQTQAYAETIAEAVFKAMRRTLESFEADRRAIEDEMFAARAYRR